MEETQARETLADGERLRRAVMPALEALLFAAEEPLGLDELQAALSDDERPAAPEALEALMDSYRQEGRGLQIVQVAGGYRMMTRAEHDRHLRALYRHRNRARLGRAALETLAIVAYRQPITAPEVGEIRGKDPGAVLKTLLEKRLIRTQGRKRVVGRPFLYATTREFLVHFGLNRLQDLPSMEEFSALIGDLPGGDEGELELPLRSDASGADRSEE